MRFIFAPFQLENCYMNEMNTHTYSEAHASAHKRAIRAHAVSVNLAFCRKVWQTKASRNDVRHMKKCAAISKRHTFEWQA